MKKVTTPQSTSSRPDRGDILEQYPEIVEELYALLGDPRKSFEERLAAATGGRSRRRVSYPNEPRPTASGASGASGASASDFEGSPKASLSTLSHKRSSHTDESGTRLQKAPMVNPPVAQPAASSHSPTQIEAHLARAVTHKLGEDPAQLQETAQAILMRAVELMLKDEIVCNILSSFLVSAGKGHTERSREQELAACRKVLTEALQTAMQEGMQQGMTEGLLQGMIRGLVTGLKEIEAKPMTALSVKNQKEAHEKPGEPAMTTKAHPSCEATSKTPSAQSTAQRSDRDSEKSSQGKSDSPLKTPKPMKQEQDHSARREAAAQSCSNQDSSAQAKKRTRHSAPRDIIL